MSASDALVIEDYAHLPSEIRTAITTARGSTDRKVVAVFQPHRVTRTTNLAQEFGTAFEGLDELIVTDIFTAGESNPDGITGQIPTSEPTRSGASDEIRSPAAPP
jgi:UDP-N-acetylmuramate--alanine ligase